jgi:glycosyltransferase involved in cell wall biosynthesis
MLERVRKRADDFDFMHFHLDYYPFPCSAASKPFVTTPARPTRPARAPACVHGIFFRSGRFDLRFPATPGSAGRLGEDGSSRPAAGPAAAFAGRAALLSLSGPLAPEKGVDRAISIARHCGVPLRIAAKVDSVDREYFDERICPLLDSSNTEYVGEIGDAEKSAFLSGAIALLVPVDWPEPFGLVMIEAMACGTLSYVRHRHPHHREA